MAGPSKRNNRLTDSRTSLYPVTRLLEACVSASNLMGGALKPWPEFVEGLFGGGLAGKAGLFFKFLISLVLQRPVIRIFPVATQVESFRVLRPAEPAAHPVDIFRATGRART
jgi:hypothetical protein